MLVAFDLMFFSLSSAKSCSHLKKLDPKAGNGTYVIDPDGEGRGPPFNVTCDMTDKNAVGVTVIRQNAGGWI